MTTTAPEKAENEAARNWCAGLLAGAGSRIDGDAAKRWTDIGVGILLSIYKDEEMSDKEKARRCDEVYKEACDANPHLPASRVVCTVGDEDYTFCGDCPLYVEEP